MTRMKNEDQERRAARKDKRQLDLIDHLESKMSKEHSRIRDNYNRLVARRDNAINPYEGGMTPKDVRKNYEGGEKQYHKDVAKYAKERGKDYPSHGHDMKQHGEGKPYGRKGA